MVGPQTRSTLFPYTTLFRSVPALTKAGGEIRGWVIDAPLQPDLDQDIRAAYAKLCAENGGGDVAVRSEEHTSELQSRRDLVCRLLLEKKKDKHSEMSADTSN